MLNILVLHKFNATVYYLKFYEIEINKSTDKSNIHWVPFDYMYDKLRNYSDGKSLGFFTQDFRPSDWNA